MKTCEYCGSDLTDKANFCGNCGKPIHPLKKDEFTIEAEDLVKTVKHLIHEGNVRRIIVKDEKGNRLLDMPVTVGVIGVVIAPWLAALGAIAAIITKCKIEVIREYK